MILLHYFNNKLQYRAAVVNQLQNVAREATEATIATIFFESISNLDMPRERDARIVLLWFNDVVVIASLPVFSYTISSYPRTRRVWVAAGPACNGDRP